MAIKGNIMVDVPSVLTKNVINCMPRHHFGQLSPLLSANQPCCKPLCTSPHASQLICMDKGLIELAATAQRRLQATLKGAWHGNAIVGLLSPFKSQMSPAEGTCYTALYRSCTARMTAVIFPASEGKCAGKLLSGLHELAGSKGGWTL